MLDRLPPELVNHILDFLPPPPAAGRADTLRALCIVSRQMYHLALPQLWREMLLGWTSQAVVLRRILADPTVNHTREAVRTVTVCGRGTGVDVPAVLPLFAHFPSLEKLVVRWCSTLNLEELQKSAPGLQFLTLMSIEFLDPLPPNFSFPSLTSLSLNDIDLPPSEYRTFLSSASLPNLRALSYTSSESLSHPANAAVFSLFTGPFVEQLDALQLTARDALFFPPGLLYLSTPTLLTARIADLSSRAPTSLTLHLRLLDRLLEGRTLQRLVRLIKNAHLSSLHLPADSSWVSEAPGGTVPALSEACVEKGVELRWYSSGGEEEHEVSQAFWRYAKEFKARQSMDGDRPLREGERRVNAG
ncbi:hypothetical protein JCM8547_002743 [Rhodosporidiobolus lusitaniae]